MLTVEQISHSFGAQRVLNGVSFALAKGSINGLIGPSGGGKSVLLKIIGEVLRPESGSVSYEDIESIYEDLELPVEKRHSIGLMFQEGALFDSLNVLDNVAFSLVGGKVPTNLLPRALRTEVARKVGAILGHVGLKMAYLKMPAQLSGGMRRRVSLARALVSRPDLVLLDDPTCGLDPVASSVIMNLIVNFHRENSPTMLIVSQDLRRLLPVVDNILALYDGRIRFNGTLDELRKCDCPFLRAFVSCRFDLDERTTSGIHPA